MKSLLEDLEIAQTNADVVRGFTEAVNQNQFDRVYEFCSPDCIFHVPPYVGLGMTMDDSSGEHILVATTAPGGRADGILLPGDALLHIGDSEHTWSTFHELKSGLWGQGIPGTPLTVIVKQLGYEIREPQLESAA